jgi:hypothetical protein
MEIAPSHHGAELYPKKSQTVVCDPDNTYWLVSVNHSKACLSSVNHCEAAGGILAKRLRGSAFRYTSQRLMPMPCGVPGRRGAEPLLGRSLDKDCFCRCGSPRPPLMASADAPPHLRQSFEDTAEPPSSHSPVVRLGSSSNPAAVARFSTCANPSRPFVSKPMPRAVCSNSSRSLRRVELGRLGLA